MGFRTTSSRVSGRVAKNLDVKKLEIGDLVEVYWYDASLGQSLSSSFSIGIDVPVSSVGVYIGTLGEKQKHIILAQNRFKLAPNLYDIDFISIPVPWATDVKVIVKGYVSADDDEVLLKNFAAGQEAHVKGTNQAEESN